MIENETSSIESGIIEKLKLKLGNELKFEQILVRSELKKKFDPKFKPNFYTKIMESETQT